MTMNLNLAPTNNKQILLVDDDVVVRAKVSESLQQDGFAVILAKNGNDGIQAYQEHRPDLVLVDAVMPLLDGFEFAKNSRIWANGLHRF